MMWLLSLFKHLDEDLPVGTRESAIVNNGFSPDRSASVDVDEALKSG